MEETENTCTTAGTTHATEPVEASAKKARRVMVCLDGSKFAETCLPYAGFMASVLGGELTLLHVMASPNGGTPGALDVLDWEIARRESEQYLARVDADLVARGLPSTRIRKELTQGQPADRVVALQREHPVFLTVLSRRGAGSALAGNLGTTAERVLASAPGSVLVVPEVGSIPPIPPGRIMVALDGSTRAESVLALVRELSSDAEMLLVHVVSEPRASQILCSGDDLRHARSLALDLETAGHEYLVQLREGLLRLQPTVRTLTARRVDTREALLDIARDERVDLLVLSAHGNTCNSAHPFGSVTAYAMAHATIPLLVVQDLEERDHAPWDVSALPVETAEGRSSLPSCRAP